MEPTEIKAALDTYHQQTAKGFEVLTEKLEAAEVKQRELSEQILAFEQRGGGSRQGGGATRKSVASMLRSSNEFMAFSERKIRAAGVVVEAKALLPPLQTKNTIVSSDATNPPMQIPGVIGGPVQRMWLRQFLMTVPVTSDSIVYTKESVFTNNAAAQASEGAAKAESDITFTEVTLPVSTMAHFLRMSRQVMDDNASLTAFVDTRLRQGLELNIEDDLLNAGNFTAFTPTAGDTAIDSLRKAKLALEAADYRAGLIVLNPADAAAIELLKTATEEVYLVGNPINGGLMSLWGVPVYVTTKVAAGTFVMLDTEQAVVLYERQEAQVEVSQSDSDNFTRNLVTIRAETRLAIAVALPDGVRSGDLTV